MDEKSLKPYKGFLMSTIYQKEVYPEMMCKLFTGDEEMTFSKAAMLMQIPLRTLKNWAKSHREFSTAFEYCLTIMQARAESQLIAQSKAPRGEAGDSKSLIFFMNKQFDDYREKKDLDQVAHNINDLSLKEIGEAVRTKIDALPAGIKETLLKQFNEFSKPN